MHTLASHGFVNFTFYDVHKTLPYNINFYDCIRDMIYLNFPGELDTIDKLFPSVSCDEAREAAIERRRHPDPALDVHKIVPSAPVCGSTNFDAVLHLRRCRDAGEYCKIYYILFLF